ncbi:MAG: DUF1674 domain-containing protein [Hyphomicrobiales bacterium]|nr:MAG: DUF1674 domain-containing protein [Hyphomicrobiales bacterium]
MVNETETGMDAGEATGTDVEARETPHRRSFEELPPAAQRALKEAEERRKASEAEPALPKELGGRKDGLEPTRYGDWEKKGILSDF